MTDYERFKREHPYLLWYEETKLAISEWWWIYRRIVKQSLIILLIAIVLLPFGWFDGFMEIRDNGFHYTQGLGGFMVIPNPFYRRDK